MEETTINKMLSDSAMRAHQPEVSASSETVGPVSRVSPQWFKSGNIIWIRDKSQDEVLRDSRGAERTIKRYVGRNRGKDYDVIKWMAQQARDHKDGNEIFSFNTGGE